MNYISTISDGMIKRVSKKIPKKVLFFPNWVDTETFFPLSERGQLKQKWGYTPEDQIVLYSGSIGYKQGLDGLIKVAATLKLKENVKFLICGTGPYKEVLIRLAEELNLKNIEFLPLQEYDVFNEFLNMADMHLVLQKGDASDLVMPSKLTSILSVGGLALVTANQGTTLHEVITTHEMGVVIPPEDERVLADAIVEIAENNYDAYRRNARRYAEQFLDKRNILPKMIDDIS